MIMDPPRLLLFLYLFLTLHLLGVTVLSQPDFLYHFCIKGVGNYTSNSNYKLGKPQHPPLFSTFRQRNRLL